MSTPDTTPAPPPGWRLVTEGEVRESDVLWDVEEGEWSPAYPHEVGVSVHDFHAVARDPASEPCAPAWVTQWPEQPGYYWYRRSADEEPVICDLGPSRARFTNGMRLDRRHCPGEFWPVPLVPPEETR